MVSLRRVQLLVLALAVVFVALAVAVSFVPQLLRVGGHAQQHLLLAVLLLAGVLPFTLLAFRFVIAPVYRTIQAQNQELRRLNEAARRRSAQIQAIHEAGSALTAELSQDVVRQAIAELSRDLVQADAAELVLATEEEEAQTHVGTPRFEKHLPVTLGIPLRYKDAVTAVLHLGRDDAAKPFTKEDEAILGMFSTQAAIALENARLYELVRALAVLEERERLAQELHDGFAQALAYVSTKTQAIQQCLLQREPEAALLQTKALVQTVRTLSEEVRSEMAGLWASTALDRPLAAVMAESLERFAEQTQMQTELIDEGDALREVELDVGERAQTLRIVQEALTNARRHARAQHVWVRCRRDVDSVILEVEDDGCGFVPEDAQGGYGLRTMQERAASIGGRLRISSRPGGGTRVRLKLPVRSRIEESVP
jgi:signal transduction histidine kinase